MKNIFEMRVNIALAIYTSYNSWKDVITLVLKYKIFKFSENRIYEQNPQKFRN